MSYGQSGSNVSIAPDKRIVLSGLANFRVVGNSEAIADL